MQLPEDDIERLEDADDVTGARIISNTKSKMRLIFNFANS